MSHPVTITELFLVAMLLVFTLPWLVWRLGRTPLYGGSIPGRRHPRSGLV